LLTSAQWTAVWDGTLITLEITAFAIVVGCLLGVVLALGRLSKHRILRALSWFYIWFFRGTPLLLQLFMVYYAIPIIYLESTGSQLNIDPMVCAFITFSLNTTAYLAEIIRAGIESIPGGQMEAAKAIGMTYGQAMRKIIIPQTYKRLIAPVGNELVMLLKDTSLVSSIALSDLLRTTKTMANASGNWLYYLYAAAIYLFLTTLLQLGTDRLEIKLGAYEKR